MNAVLNAFNFVKANWKMLLALFGLGGTVTVLGVIPGSENVSNILGTKITEIKTTLGTAASPTIVQ